MHPATGWVMLPAAAAVAAAAAAAAGLGWCEGCSGCSGWCGGRTLEMVRAGLHWSFKMSRQMLPWLLTLGWYTLVWNATWPGMDREGQDGW
jgi:hypothetical protein